MGAKMKDVIVGALVVILAGTAFYFYQKAESAGDNSPKFGQLSALNRLVLVTQEYTDSCTHHDDEGLGEGTIVYDWKFEFGYGLDFPLNYAWNVQEPTVGNYVVEAPPLKQLHPLVVDFTRFIETDEANGDRWQRMYEYAKPAAFARMERATEVNLKANDELTSQAKASVESFILQILRAANPEKTVSSVTVNFETSDSPLNEDQLINKSTC